MCWERSVEGKGAGGKWFLERTKVLEETRAGIRRMALVPSETSMIILYLLFRASINLYDKEV